MVKGLWIAVPCHTGMITAETAASLNAEMYAAFDKKWMYQVQFCPHNPMIHYVRNQMVRQFMESDYSDMIFVDSDVGFEPGTLCKLASYPVDIIGAVYPHRADPITYPIRYIAERTELCGGTEPGTEQILEVEGIPAGCMKISRHAIETICKAHPELTYKDMNGIGTYSLFEFTRRDGEFLGEDWAFCKLARDCGLKIWVDPEINMTHTGAKTFHGNLGKHLRGRDVPDYNAMMDNIMKFTGTV